MPIRRRRRTGFRRRRKPADIRSKRAVRRARNKPETKVIRFSTGISDRLRVKLKYVELINHSVAFTNAVQVFRANSLFDPNFTGVGAQPRYFDQWAAVYQQYRVYGCRMKISVTCTSAATPIHVATVFTDSDPSSESFIDISEARYGKYHGMISQNTAGPQTRIFSRYMTMRKLHGVKDLANSDDLAAQVTTNPADPSFVAYALQSIDAVGTTSAFVRVELTYYAEFFGPQLVSDS